MKDILIIVLFLLVYFSPVFYQLSIVIKENKRGNKRPLKRFKKVFKYSLIVLLPLAIGFGILNYVNFLDYESPITYDRVNKITFENFRGLEFFKKSLYGNKRFAYVVTSFRSDIDKDSVGVEALFHPSSSFVYNTHNDSKELLRHEIYHFKITELYARKAKKKIAALRSPNKKEIRHLIEQMWNEERNFQAKYDFDTFHSYVFSEQKRYERAIDSLLTLHSEYQRPKVPLNE